MKATELRIGNCVNECYQVVEIDNLGCGICSPMDDLASYIDFEYKDIKPIPITEDWLLKFGFTEGKYGYSLSLEHQTLWVKLDGETAIADGFELIRLTKCKHVHQLQNLYHALTGEELTIKEE